MLWILIQFNLKGFEAELATYQAQKLNYHLKNKQKKQIVLMALEKRWEKEAD
jgi:hypothetical protein